MLYCSCSLYTLIYSVILCLYYLHAETEQGVAQAIIRSVIDFRRDPWPKVSDNAKDLVKRMLDPDPKRRLTAQEVLGNYHFLINCCFLFFLVLNHCKFSLERSSLCVFVRCKSMG